MTDIKVTNTGKIETGPGVEFVDADTGEPVEWTEVKPDQDLDLVVVETWNFAKDGPIPQATVRRLMRGEVKQPTPPRISWPSFFGGMLAGALLSAVVVILVFQG
jgi:hypothetical protein